jgi:hypothetical protein
VLPSLNIPQNLYPAVQLQIPNREVSHSNLDRNTPSTLRRVIVCLSPQSNARTVSEIGPISLSFTPFRIHYSLKILPSDTVQSQLLEAPWNTPQINECGTMLSVCLYQYSQACRITMAAIHLWMLTVMPPKSASRTNKIHCPVISWQLA